MAARKDRSDQGSPSLKRAYCSWVKLGSVRKPNLRYVDFGVAEDLVSKLYTPFAIPTYR